MMKVSLSYIYDHAKPVLFNGQHQQNCHTTRHESVMSVIIYNNAQAKKLA